MVEDMRISPKQQFVDSVKMWAMLGPCFMPLITPKPGLAIAATGQEASVLEKANAKERLHQSAQLQREGSQHVLFEEEHIFRSGLIIGWYLCCWAKEAGAG